MTVSFQFERGGSLIGDRLSHCTTGRSNLFESHRQRRWLTVGSYSNTGFRSERSPTGRRRGRDSWKRTWSPTAGFMQTARFSTPSCSLTWAPAGRNVWRYSIGLRLQPTRVPAEVLRATHLSDNFAPSGKAPTEGDLLQAELQLPVLEQRKKRRYRRTNKPRVPHTWRTRPDPFDGVWKEVQSWLKSEPERTAKSLVLQLQQRDPARYSNGQLRTMQHRVREWRRQILVSFNAKWLELDRFGLTQASPKAAGDNGCGKDGRFATVENPFQLIDRSATFLMRQREK